VELFLLVGMRVFRIVVVGLTEKVVNLVNGKEDGDPNERIGQALWQEGLRQGNARKYSVCSESSWSKAARAWLDC